jgi:uncharacterized protein
MEMRIIIKTGNVVAQAELNQTNTAKAIWKALPISGKVNLWGDEVYFTIPLHVELEDGKEVVNAGDLGFWPSGDAFCIFFGRTPVSRRGEIRPASAVNVFGRLTGEIAVFNKAIEGDRITIERAGE